jgi:proline iminopeptidase
MNFKRRAAMASLIGSIPAAAMAVSSATNAAEPDKNSQCTRYLDNTRRADISQGGVRMITVSTPSGPYKVWTRRFGNNPHVKVLLLHGGPGFTHEYLEVMDSFLPPAGIEYYYYDQLGAGRSDKPDDDDLWTLERFVDEVEQVRIGLGLDEKNLCLFGQSWGGILGVEYALAHQDKMKALIVSNAMSSMPAYNAYAKNVLAKYFKPELLTELRQLEAAGKFDDPRYMEILMSDYYERHILRAPFAEWPEPLKRSFDIYNRRIYELMQGPSEFGLRGRLETWDRSKDLAKVKIPALTIGAKWDTMDSTHMAWMAKVMPKGRYLHCEGSHCSMYDDQQRYMSGLVNFLHDIA